MSRAHRIHVVLLLGLAEAALSACSPAGSSADAGVVSPDAAAPGNDAAGPTGDDGGATGDDGGATGDDGGATGDDGGATGDDGGTSGGDGATTVPEASAPEAGDAGGPTGFTCSTGALVEGDVAYNGTGQSPNPAGQGLFADPPVAIEKTAWVGSVLHATALHELWYIDFSKATPSIARSVGVDPATENDDVKFNAGPCASARLAQVSGIAAAPDGSLFVTDESANAVVHVTGAGTAACAVAYYAGTSAPADAVGVLGVNPGDQDGPGAAAMFDQPGYPTVDSAGNVYVLDNHIEVKKIATDAAHTVSTVVTLPTDTQDAQTTLTYLNGKLYTIHTQVGLTTFQEIDPATGAIRNVYQGATGADFPPLADTASPAFGALTTDGTRLIAAADEGYVWTLTTAGVLTYAAGDGVNGFSAGYDPTVVHPVDQLALPGITSEVNLSFSSGGIFYTSNDTGNAFIIRIGCP